MRFDLYPLDTQVRNCLIIEKYLQMSLKIVQEMKSGEDTLDEEFQETANWMGDFTKYALVESDRILNMKSDND